MTKTISELVDEIKELSNRLVGILTNLKKILLEVWGLVLQCKNIVVQLLVLGKSLIMLVINKLKALIPSK